MITTRKRRLDDERTFEVYIGAQPLALNLTKVEQKRLARTAKRIVRRHTSKNFKE